MERGLIFNIQRYAFHDGSGIRTVVFLQGCPLHCLWCSNPESQGAVKPVTWYKNGQAKTVGQWYTLDAVLAEIEKDEIFYQTSGGGITLSGGECLVQADFSAALLRAVKSLGIPTAIETTGALPITAINKVLPYTDEVLFDLKIMAQPLAKQVIGDNVAFVKASFEAALQASETTVIPRIPLIPGYTAQMDNLHQIIDYLHQCGVKKVHLLPFHQYGSQKYHDLNRAYALEKTPLLTSEAITQIHDLFTAENIDAVVYGLD